LKKPEWVVSVQRRHRQATRQQQCSAVKVTRQCVSNESVVDASAVGGGENECIVPAVPVQCTNDTVNSRETILLSKSARYALVALSQYVQMTQQLTNNNKPSCERQSHPGSHPKRMFCHVFGDSGDGTYESVNLHPTATTSAKSIN
jgi:hypothetical protein